MSNNKNIEIRVCMGSSGIASGGGSVLDAFKSHIKEAGIEASFGEHCSVHKVGCRGLCARDVLVDVLIDGNKTTYQHVTIEMVPKIVSEHIIGGSPITEWTVKEDYQNFNSKQVKIVLSDCGNIDPEDINAYMAIGGYEAVKAVLCSMSREAVIDTIKRSGLRGRGGGGFPTGAKWEACSKINASQKYIICNAGEGSPIIEGNPHTVIEGMIIGAYAIGADRGYVYVRTEHPLVIERLKIALRQAEEKNFLGENILGTGFNFDLKIKLGAGAFICGEETALIASIEGERGMPRAKPPFPVYNGLWGKPTIINNVETLANVPYIIRNGAEWFASYGTEESKGTKVFALTGKVRNSGLIEVPMNISLREIIYDIGGGIEGDRKLKAIQTGGPTGGCITADMIDANMSYESLMQLGTYIGSGGMIVLDETDCMVNVARYFLQFTQAESCGKCVPCRIGTKRLLEIMDRIIKGKGTAKDLENLEALGRDMKATSLCGLGQGAPNPILSTLRYFRHEYEAHLEGRCPAKVCRDLIKYSVLEEFCKGCGACMRACPAGAITGERKKPHVINQDLCIKCGACFEVCKFKAVVKE